jgi:hypothetical protein
MWQPSSRWKGALPAALSARSSTRWYSRPGDRRITARRQAFKITVRDLGDLKPELSLDNVTELIEQLEDSPLR